MKNTLVIEGKNLVSSHRAAELTKYSNDYIGQLCREGKVSARMIGRSWFIEEDSILAYQKNAELELKNHYENLRNPFIADRSPGDHFSSPAGFGKDDSTTSLGSNGLRGSSLTGKNISYFSDDRPMLPELKKNSRRISSEMMPNDNVSSVGRDADVIGAKNDNIGEAAIKIKERARLALDRVSSGITFAGKSLGLIARSRTAALLAAIIFASASAHVFSGALSSFQPAVDLYDQASNAAAPAMTPLTPAINAISTMADWFSKPFLSLAQDTRRIGGGAISGIASIAGNAYDSLSSAADDTFRSSSMAISNTADSVSSMPAAVWDAASSFWNSTIFALRAGARSFLGIKDNTIYSTDTGNAPSGGLSAVIPANAGIRGNAYNNGGGKASSGSGNVSNGAVSTIVERVIREPAPAPASTLSEIELANRITALEAVRNYDVGHNQLQANAIGNNIGQSVGQVVSGIVRSGTLTSPTITSATITGSSFSGSTGAFTGNIAGGGNLSISGTSALIGTSTVAGNLGVGTTSPFTNLSVNGSGYFAGNITVTNLIATGTVSVGGITTGSGTGTSTFAGPIGSASGNFIIGSAGTTNNLLLNPYGGNIGIGTTSPWAQLSVNPNGVSGPAFAIGSSTATNFVVTNGGNVGIGTTAPQTLLEISRVVGGNGNVLLDGNSSVTGAPKMYFVDSVGATVTTAPSWMFSDTADALSISRATSLNGSYSSFVTINNTGNFGIGTTSPTSPLSVQGNFYSSGTGFFGGAITATSTLAVTGNITGAGGIAATIPYASTTAITSSGAAYLNNLAVGSYAAAGQTAAPSNGFIVSGNVGIGTTSPASVLDVYSNSAQMFNFDERNSAYSVGKMLSQGIPLYDFNYTSAGLTSAATLRLYSANAINVNVNANGNSYFNGGNVGIGTTSPWAQLSVNPNGVSGPAFAVGSSTATNFVVTNGGNVGVGTANPIQALDVNGNININGGDCIYYGATNQGSLCRNGTTGALTLSSQNSSTANMVFALGSSLTSFQFTGGNIGIGTTSPASLLALHGSAPVLTLGDTQASSREFQIRNGSVAAGKLDIYDLGNAASRLTIDGSGNVGIGTTGPGQKLSVIGGRALIYPNSETYALGLGYSSGVGGAFWLGTSNSSTPDLLFQNNTGNELMRITNGGNVGIGTTSPWAQLSVNPNGISGPAFAIGSSTATIFQVTNGGNIYATSTALWGTSDQNNTGLALNMFQSNASDTVSVLAGLSGGPFTAEPDAGNISLFDMPVTSNTPNGTTTSASLRIAESNVLTIQGTSDGAGNITNPSVGIGTSSPFYSTLSVWGPDTLATSRVFEVNNNASTTLLAVQDNGTAYLSGNLGIGTTSPAQLLSVSGNGYLTGGLGVGKATTTAGALDIAGNGVFGGFLSASTFNATSTTATSTFAGGLNVAGSSGLTVLQNGNVGIGTAGPGASLEVAGSSIFLNPSSASNATLQFKNTSALKGLTGWINSTGNIYLGQDGAAIQGININSSGSVGIGTTSPASLLALHGSAPVLTLGDTQASSREFQIRNGSVAAGKLDIYDLGNAASRLTIDGSGNVGIGTTSPNTLFSVAGGGMFSTAVGSNSVTIETDLSVGSSANLVLKTLSKTFTLGSNAAISGFSIANTTDGTTPFVITTGGNIGIGTTSPSQTLSVQGNSYVSGTAFFGGAITATSTLTLSNLGLNMILTSNGSGTLVASSTPTAANYLATSTTATSTFSGGFTAGNNAAFSVNQAASANSLYIAGNGTVGIGTAAPGAKLEVNGNIRVSTNAQSVLSNVYDLISPTVNGQLFPTITSGNIILGGGSMSGNVGIASTSPWALLSVNPNGISGPAFAIGSSTATNFVVTNGGNVGVGTANPTALLHVKTTSSGVNPIIISENDANVQSYFYTGRSGNTQTTGKTVVENPSANALLLNPSGGNVGVGSTSPGTLLSIGGNATGINFVDGTNATSTISGNLYVQGTLRAKVSYVGDLFFGNNFSFSEAPLKGTTQGLLLRNQKGEDVFTADENGNISTAGDVCYQGNQCFGKTLNNLTALASTTSNSLFSIQASTATTSASLSQLTASAGAMTNSLANLTGRISILESATANLNASTTLLDSIASSTAAALLDDVGHRPFIQQVADAILNALKSSTDWVFAKISSTLAVFTRVQTQTAAVTQGLEMTDQTTGQVYCVTIKNGDWSKVAGNCQNGGTAAVTATSTASTIIGNVPVVNSVTATNNQTPITNNQTNANNQVLNNQINTTTSVASTASTSSIQASSTQATSTTKEASTTTSTVPTTSTTVSTTTSSVNTATSTSSSSSPQATTTIPNLTVSNLPAASSTPTINSGVVNSLPAVVSNPAPPATPTPTSSPTPTPIKSPAMTPTTAVTSAPIPSSTPTPTATPVAKVTSTPSVTPAPAPSSTP